MNYPEMQCRLTKIVLRYATSDLHFVRHAQAQAIPSRIELDNVFLMNVRAPSARYVQNLGYICSCFMYYHWHNINVVSYKEFFSRNLRVNSLGLEEGWYAVLDPGQVGSRGPGNPFPGTFNNVMS